VEMGKIHRTFLFQYIRDLHELKSTGRYVQCLLQPTQAMEGNQLPCLLQPTRDNPNLRARSKKGRSEEKNISMCHLQITRGTDEGEGRKKRKITILLSQL